MDPLANAWFVLDSMNKLTIPFGLSLPFELGSKTARTKEKHRKITSLVLFVIVSMSLLCVGELYKNNNVSAIPSLIMASSTCCLILGRRYAMLEDTSSVLEKMLTVEYPQALLNISRGRTLLLDLLEKNWVLLLKTITLFSIVSLKIYLHVALHVILQTILDLMLIAECFLISCILDVVHELIERIEATTTHLYSEFYRSPPAEMKKADKGDFVLLGWISAALARRRSGADVEPLERNLASLVGLADALDVFKETFPPAVSAVFLVCAAGLVEKRCEIVDVALQVYLWGCLWSIFWKCGNIGVSIRSLGNSSFKLYVDIPSRVFLEEEIEFKNVLYLIYQFAMNEESWTICLFKTIQMNPRIIIKILISILLLYCVDSIIQQNS